MGAGTRGMAGWRIIEGMSGHLDRVAAAAKVFRKAEAATKRARADLHAKILEATEAMPFTGAQAQIAEASTYKREQVRRIVDAARKAKADADA